MTGKTARSTARGAGDEIGDSGSRHNPAHRREDRHFAGYPHAMSTTKPAAGAHIGLILDTVSGFALNRNANGESRMSVSQGLTQTWISPSGSESLEILSQIKSLQHSL